MPDSDEIRNPEVERRLSANKDERERFAKHLRVVERALELRDKKRLLAQREAPAAGQPASGDSLLDW